MIVYLDMIEKLVDEDVSDAYEGTGQNDKTLGRMYYLKQYAKAAEGAYDKLRAELDTSSVGNEKAVFQSDPKFSAVGGTTSGRKSLDREALSLAIAELFNQINPGSQIRSQVAASELLDRCTKYTKDSVTVSVVPNS